MSNVKNRRAGYLLLGVMVMALSGIFYGWTNYSELIRAETGWSPEALSITLTIWSIGSGLGGVLAGFVLRRLSMRATIFIGMILQVGGYTLSTLAGSTVLGGSIWFLYIFFGACAGIGSGFAYIPTMNVVVEWYPDKVGFASGVMMFGLGVGTLALGSGASFLAEAIGWRNAFYICAAVVLIVLLLDMFLIKKPDTVLPSQTPEQKKTGVWGKEYTPSQMLRRASFWLFFIWAVLGQTSNMIVSTHARQSADEINAAGILATMAVGVLHVFCSIGSIGFGTVYDKLGRKKTMLLESTVLIVGALLFVGSMYFASVTLMVIGLVVLGLVTGGLPATNSAYIREFYGEKNYPVNLAIVSLRAIPASLGAYMGAAIYTASGSYLYVYLTMTAMLVFNFIINLFIRKP